MKAKGWAIWVGVSVFAIHLLPAQFRDAGIYFADAPERGEPWRWFVAHLIHRSWPHLLFNVVSWALACWVLAPVLSHRQRWAWGLGWVAIGISASLAMLHPKAPPFVGLSALVYAWLVAGAVQGLALRRFRFAYASLILVLGAKQFLEPYTGRAFGGATLVALGPSAGLAHAQAYCWGLLWGGIGWLMTRFDDRKPS